MAENKKKEYGNMRIMSLDGSRIWRCQHEPNSTRTLTALSGGKLSPDAFDIVFDESLDTDKLAEVYEKHQSEMGYPYIVDKLYCRAIVTVSFKYSVKEYEQRGHRYIKYGYTVTDADMQDHICVRNGMLIAIDVPTEKDKKHSPVENPAAAELLGEYFEYDEKRRAYKRSGKNISAVANTSKIRESLYADGFDIDGIHYVRYKRSAGASRNGRCLFIAEPLYADMVAWSSCGLSADSVLDQASWQAYISLSLSTIIDTIKLPKKALLIIPDKVSKFTTTAVCVKDNCKDGLVAAEEETEIENVIWDGEALMDVSVFEENGYEDKAMMLLRNRFFKSCAFNTNLQKWFKDNGITEIRQLAGYTTARKVEDIKLVVTESSVKYLKFMPKGSTYAEGFKAWLDAVYEGKNTIDFGVVKTDKPPKFMNGNMAQTNYQLLNTINITPEYMEQFLKNTTDFLAKIQKDSMYLRYYTKMLIGGRPRDLDNYRDCVMLDMLERTDLFEFTELYKTHRSDVCRNFKERMKKGHILVTGNYQTIFGNPYEFLSAVIDKKYEPTESLLLGEYEAYTTRFEEGARMLGARSPHITMGNLYVVVNKKREEIDEYFNLTPDIICINAIGDNIQQRLNGCDYDSDSMLVTTNYDLFYSANYDYRLFGVPVCKVTPSGKTDYVNTPKSLAELDVTIAENKIGEIVNLSQFLNSLFWHELSCGKTFEEMLPMYYDICKLAVMSGMEIDKAKRMYSINANKVLAEIKKTRKAFKDKNGGALPSFFTFMTANEKSKAGDGVKMQTPMSFLYDTVENFKSGTIKTHNIPLSSMFALDAADKGNNDSHKKADIIKIVSEAQKNISYLQARARAADKESKAIFSDAAEEIFENCLKEVSKNIVNDHILCLLLKELDKEKMDKEISACRQLLFASMLCADNGRLLNRITGADEFVFPELRLWEHDPKFLEGCYQETIYGYPHVIYDFTRAKKQEPTE